MRKDWKSLLRMTISYHDYREDFYISFFKKRCLAKKKETTGMRVNNSGGITREIKI